MWLAHHFHGLNIGPEELDRMTPEDTRAMREAGERVLIDDEKAKFAHTKVIATAASGARL